MMSNNKILTVSYGTFSCTLEGFDDSFGTMKAIAEYFRDLASDDRYFGAEPPQPDAEMLSRIAQKEISRRVEVREHEGKIVLSAAGAQETATPEQVEPAALIDPTALTAPKVNEEAEAMIAAEAARAATAQAEAKAEQDRVQAEADAKADADAKIADAKIKAQAEEARQQEARLEEARLEEARQDAERAEADAKQAEAVDEAQETPTPRDLAAELPEADAFFAASNTDAEDGKIEVSKTVAVAGAATAVAQGNSIAAKLERIRAVVSKAEHTSDDDDFSEDEHAVDFGAKAVAQPEIEAGIEAEEFDISGFSVETTDGSDPKAETLAAEENVKADVKAKAISDIQAASQADEAADAIDDQVDMDDDDMSAILARLEGNDNDVNIAENDNLFDETAKDDDAFYDNNDDDDASLDIELEVDDLSADASAIPAEQRGIARVIKVKRADLEAAIAQGDLEEVDDLEAEIDSTLSDADEAELVRELAEVEGGHDDLEGESLFEDTTSKDTSAASHTLPAIDEDQGDDLSRLMAEADQQMDDEEGKQSRDAFAHLKAAVAAKNADVGLAQPTPEEEEVAYRSDLATAVKPRRPASGKGRAERTVKTERPSPLKLVAEQRVDAEDMDKRGPVRPRRIALREATATDEHGSFIEFAEDMGASELPDLLEAAASYMSFVEGCEQFSRPQLMSRVRSVENENFSREDGLRSFGKLLRAGKIEKIKGGRFTVTSDIGYRPDTRAVG